MTCPHFLWERSRRYDPPAEHINMHKMHNHLIQNGKTMNGETEERWVNQDYSQREFFKATALTVGAVEALSMLEAIPAESAGNPAIPAIKKSYL